MTGQDIIDAVRSTLVEPVAGFWSDAEILAWVNRAELDFNNRTHILEGKSVTGTTEGVGEIPLPSNCLSVRLVLYNNANTGSGATPNWVRVYPSNLEKFGQQTPNFLNTTTGAIGAPRSYAIWGRNLVLYPPPDNTTDSNITMYYKAKPIPVSLAASSLNLDDSFKDGLIAYVLWKAYEKEQEVDKSLAQQQIYETYVRHGLRWQKKQSGDQRNRIDISSPTPFEGPFDGRFNPIQ